MSHRHDARTETREDGDEPGLLFWSVCFVSCALVCTFFLLLILDEATGRRPVYYTADPATYTGVFLNCVIFVLAYGIPSGLAALFGAMALATLDGFHKRLRTKLKR